MKSRPTQPGLAESAIRAKIHAGQRLGTPSQGAPFIVERIDARGVVLLFGEKETPTPFSWDALEEALDFLLGRGWVQIGGVFDTSSTSGTFDEHLKGYMKRATANWVASMFEAAGLVQIDRNRPSRVRAIRSRSPESEVTGGSIPDRPKTEASVCSTCFLTLPTSGICGSCD